MPNGFLNPNDFTIAPGDMRSLQDRMLELNRSLSPSLQGPPVGGQPNQTQNEQNQSSLVKSILSQVPNFLGQAAAQAETPPGEKVKPKTADDYKTEFQGLVNQGTNPFAPKESIGSPFIGKLLHGKDEGGIFGTGIMPLDVLAFALGAAVTSKMPQDKAIATTMMLAKMPSEFRKNQEEAGTRWIQQQLQAVNAATGMANAQTSSLKAAQAKQEFDSGMNVANAIELTDPVKAEAFRANRVDDLLKLTGGDKANLPPHLNEALDAIAQGQVPLENVPRELKAFGVNGENYREVAKQWHARNLANQTPFIDATGKPWVRAPSGGWIPQEQSVGRTVAPQSALPLPSMQTESSTPPLANAPVRRLEPTPSGGFVAPGVPPATNAPVAPTTEATLLSPQNIYSRMSPDERLKVDIATTQMEKDLGLRLPKELDVGTKAKILASKSALDYSEKLKLAYEKMINSYGGEKKFDFSTRAQVFAYIGGSSMGGGSGGLGEAVAVKTGQFLSAAVEEYGNITKEAQQFKALYDQAQKFARGAMQDTGNLALNERARFENMLGSVINKPFTVKSALNEFQSAIGADYNDLLRMNVPHLPRGFEPWEPKKAGQPSKPSWVLPEPKSSAGRLLVPVPTESATPSVKQTDIGNQFEAISPAMRKAYETLIQRR